jgi:hypothetical protein
VAEQRPYRPPCASSTDLRRVKLLAGSGIAIAFVATNFVATARGIAVWILVPSRIRLHPASSHRTAVCALGMAGLGRDLALDAATLADLEDLSEDRRLPDGADSAHRNRRHRLRARRCFQKAH